MGAGGPAQGIEWLIRADDREERLPAGERIEVDDAWWRFTHDRIKVGPDIRIFLSVADVRRSMTVEVPQGDPEPYLLTSAALSGRVLLDIGDGVAAEVSPDRGLVFRPHGRRGVFTLSPGRRVRLVGFMVRIDRAKSILGDATPDSVRPLLEDEITASRAIATAVGSRYRQIARTLFDSRLNGPLRTIFMEGVAIQLLAMQLDAAVNDGQPNGSSPHLQDAIAAARKHLLADMRAAPTVAHLAQTVGVAERELIAGFRTYYDKTAFELLRDERLEQARLAIETTALPIKQIAHRVGYNHVSNFTSAFTARYGIPPARLRARATPNGVGLG